MEYAKDILISINKGQVGKSRKKKHDFIKKCMKHKFIITIVSAMIGFIILDLVLISNFVNILIEI